MPKRIPKVLTELLCFFILCSLMGCADAPVSRGEKTIARKLSQKVFFYPYESVWRAAQLALKYPMAVNNMDTGVLETEFIKGLDGFVLPYVKKDPSAGLRYKIYIQMAKGRIEGKESVRVTVIKNIELQRDFFTAADELDSDGYEEKVILYRIERELVIDEALKKAAKNAG